MQWIVNKYRARKARKNSSRSVEMYLPEPGNDRELGRVTWCYNQSSAGISSPAKITVPQLADAKIEAIRGKGGQPLLRRVLALSDEFHIEICGSQAKVDSGFAINGNLRTDAGFAWDWFIVDQEGHATKLQETGELELTYAMVGDDREIVGTKFLSDVSLRMSTMAYLATGVSDVLNPEYRIEISAGSHILWPVLVDGVVVVREP